MAAQAGNGLRFTGEARARAFNSLSPQVCPMSSKAIFTLTLLYEGYGRISGGERNLAGWKNLSKRDTKVFRFSCELYEEIAPDILGKRWTLQLNPFPFQKRYEKGLAWYYFEDSRLKPVVTQEHRRSAALCMIQIIGRVLFEGDLFP